MASAISMSSPSVPINLSKAQQQHAAYAKVLERIVPQSVHLDADDAYPDCVFIEDTAVVIDDRAVICRIGAESRRGEVEETKDVLLDMGLSVLDMRNDAPTATCDGGDVLYPVSYHRNADGTRSKRGGKHLFVGLSKRTNDEGVQYLQNAFPNVEVIPVQVNQTDGEEALHLKSVVTHMDDETLIVPSGPEWDHVVTSMEAEAKGYKIVRAPDIAACNVVSANGCVIAQPDICEESKDILQMEVEQKRGLSLVYVDASEFAKYDGALTCKSILIP
jgi:dimethylargininase